MGQPPLTSLMRAFDKYVGETRNGLCRECENKSPKCDQCDSVTVNGIYCHEHGCPNRNSRWDAENKRWVKQYECRRCGGKVDIGDSCCYSGD
jgi:hypothetical protein